jgi:hypothetical protein
VVRDIQHKLAGQAHNTHQYVEESSDFDERILAFQAEMDLLNAQKELENHTPGTLYDLPHASVKTTPKFNPEYAD